MDFEEILKKLKENLLQLVKDEYEDFKGSGEKVVNDFLNQSKQKLEKWTNLLANNIITIEEYEWLLKSQKDLFEMKALYAAGISKIKLERFKNKTIQTIVDVVVQLVL